MAIIKCKMCGGDLNVQEGMTVAECEYCGTKQTVPTIDNEKKLTLFARANRLRLNNEFDKAAGIYESIIADFPEEAEAYWGLVLCTYGIEYVDDPLTAKKVPTCHRSSFDSVMDDNNFELAMEYSDLIARRVYRDEAKQIEELRKGIIEVSSKEEPYDIFISYKELSEDGNRTLDSVIAQDIYTALTERGYRVFFSRISLEDKLGTEYEPYIFAALNSAKLMLVVGTDYEHFNAVWVKNEWSRFLSLIAHGEKKALIPVFKGIDAYDMPKEFNKLSAQDWGKLGAMQDLLRGVEKILGGKKEEAPAPTVPVQQAVSPNVSSLLERGMMFLEDKDWDSADEYFNKVLDIDPKNGEAYYGKLMVERRVSGISEIQPSESGARKFVTSAKAYKRFEQFGTPERKAELEARLAECDEAERIERERKAEAERIERERRAEEERIAREKSQRKRIELAPVREKLDKFGKLISAGLIHTVGLRSDGTVVAVGNNAGGKCDISAWTDVVAISAGYEHTVGLRSDGTVVATKFIENKYNKHFGQCDVSDWTDSVAIAAGKNHTVGLRSDGTVVATKYTGNKQDYCGQCDVSAWTDVVAVSAGSSHTVGLRSDGTVVATKYKGDLEYKGDSEYYHGQCEVSEWTDVVAVSAGLSHTVGLRSDGTVVAVGWNVDDRCDVSAWTDVVAIAVGFWHTVGLRSDGTVVAVGDNKYGQCDVSAWTDVVAVSAGVYHTVGLRSDGTVVAVGKNDCGRCDVTDWKLFNSVDTYDEEVAAERKAREEKEAAERKAREEKEAAERKASEEKKAALTEEKAQLTAELPNLQGMFKAGKRKEVEARLAEIEKELENLR